MSVGRPSSIKSCGCGSPTSNRMIMAVAILLIVGPIPCMCSVKEPENKKLQRPARELLQSGGFTGVKAEYAQLLGLSWQFYEAQRSGYLPSNNRIPWRGNSFTKDKVPGGWHDAGDTMKFNINAAPVVSYLAWSVLEFRKAYEKTGQLTYALDNIKWAADYLVACHISDYEYVGQIGDSDIEYKFWGRPEDQLTSFVRPALVVDKNSPASNLLAVVSAALSSTALVFRGQGNEPYASHLLRHALDLYSWAKKPRGSGLFQDAYPSINTGYATSTYLDKLMYAAAWLYRATGNSNYLADAKTYWDAGPKIPSVYVDVDSLYAPAVNLLLSKAAQGLTIPNSSKYSSWFTKQFLFYFQKALKAGDAGEFGITRTPKGLIHVVMGDEDWGTLGESLNVAFQMLLYAQYTTNPSDKSACIKFAQSQVNYTMGYTMVGKGRSYIVGWGKNYPQFVHHEAASCPNRPAKCGWDQFNSPKPNPQVIKGAVVNGPGAKDAYTDKRDDYLHNEPAIQNNGGFTGALAGLLVLL